MPLYLCQDLMSGTYLFDNSHSRYAPIPPLGKSRKFPGVVYQSLTFLGQIQPDY